MKQGWVKLHRSLLDWEWYEDLPCRVLFLHCLLKANFAETRYKGKILQRGEFLTGRQALADETGLTVQQVRTALEKLTETGELFTTPNRSGTKVTVSKYESYQDYETPPAKKKAAKAKKPKQEAKELLQLEAEPQNDAQKLPHGEKFADAWTDWLAFRKEIKKPIKSERTKQGQLKKLAKLNESDAIITINHSIDNGYQGLFPDRFTSGNMGGNRSHSSRNSGTANAADHVLEQYRKKGL